ncbi:MAG: hypothetical protein U0174_25210 [Polyangiaceae bacterium]
MLRSLMLQRKSALSFRSVTLVSALLGAAGIAALPTGCGGDGDSTFGDSGTNSDGSSGSSGSSGFGNGNNDGGQTGVQYSEIRVEPLDAKVDVALGATTPPIAYKVFAKRTATSPEEEVNAQLSFDRIDAASFTGATLTPTGFIGAKGKVTAKAGGKTATTTATFRMIASAGTAPAANVIAAMNAATDTDATLKVLYPYDKTVFPRGIPGPLVQWNGVTGNNSYRFILTSESFQLTTYATSSGANGELSFPVAPVDIWSKLADSSIGKVEVAIQRFDGTKAYKPVTQTWNIAGANLKGTVYYTRLSNSDAFVRRIEPGKTAQSFIQKQGEGCIACHSVSKNGERVVAGINGGASPWGVWDARTGQRLYQSSQASGFQAISPDGNYVLWRHWNSGSFGSDGKLILSTYNSDATVADFVPPGADGAPSHPVWSPDGKMIALGMRTAGNGLSYTAATIALTDVSLQAPIGFSNYRKIVLANGQYPVATYPTFTPDSKWLGFMRANKSRGSDADSLGELWVTDLTGATQIRLDQANGAGVLPATNKSWGPSFHPVAAGGYFWVAFYSQRNWGHKFTASNRQLWIAAVDANFTGGVDPSHPAFYVQGQETDSTNERPQFAVPPCKQAGETCESGYECCDGRFCRAGADGKMTCQEPKPDECAQIGDTCKVDADCCDNIPCVAGTCQNPPPK